MSWENTYSIDSLSQLGEMKEVKVNIIRNSYVAEAINDIKTLGEIESEGRIIYRDIPSGSDHNKYLGFFSEMFQSIAENGYVLIEASGNFETALWYLRTSDPCKFKMADFGTSRETLFGTPYGWPMAKNFSLSELVNKEVMWLSAYGLDDTTWMKANDGIFFPGTTMGGHPCPAFDAPTDASLDIREAECPPPSKSLSLGHLRVISVIWAVGMAAAILEFVAELAVGRC